MLGTGIQQKVSALVGFALMEEAENKFANEWCIMLGDKYREEKWNKELR